MDKTIRVSSVTDCACVIHSTAYSWDYVERLFSMLQRHLHTDIRMHVYTERNRFVPPQYIKHSLEEWQGISGPKRSWWYKMQLFNPEFHQGPLLYFDLDCVVTRDLHWVAEHPPEYLWAIRDFKHLQNPHMQILNSSVMWWDTRKFADVWNKFKVKNINEVVRHFPGDQDYLTSTIESKRRHFFPDKYFESYRWQVVDGGYDFTKRQHNTPGTGAAITSDTSVIVFHGQPKPDQVNDPLIKQHWC